MIQLLPTAGICMAKSVRVRLGYAVDLPAGLSARPLTLADAPAVAAIVAAQEIVDLGEALIEEADIVADWQRPSFRHRGPHDRRLRRRQACGLRGSERQRPR